MNRTFFLCKGNDLLFTASKIFSDIMDSSCISLYSLPIQNGKDW